jgi:hypothetical protein
MRRRREKIVGAELLAQWRERLGVLRQRLVEAPGAEDAWFWRIQFHLIWFLLERYDPKGLRRLADGTAEVLPVEQVKLARPAVLEMTPVGLLRARAAGKGPRVSKEIGPALARISDSNRDRYEKARKASEELAAAIARENEKSRAIIAERVARILAEQELAEMNTLIVTELPPTMTDEQIREILLNAGIVLPEDEEEGKEGKIQNAE